MGGVYHNADYDSLFCPLLRSRLLIEKIIIFHQTQYKGKVQTWEMKRISTNTFS